MSVQFYLNGYRPGDPLVARPHPAVAERPAGLPEKVDVLIVGCGPAGLVLAAQLAAFPDLTIAVVDRREGPLEVGQADGVACRTVEMFEAFGLADQLVTEGYWVNQHAKSRVNGTTRHIRPIFREYYRYPRTYGAGSTERSCSTPPVRNRPACKSSKRSSPVTAPTPSSSVGPSWPTPT